LSGRRLAGKGLGEVSVSRHTRLASSLIVLSLATALPAEEPRQASGQFTGREWSFEPMGAYAFPSKVGLGDDQGIRIAVSNAGFIADYVDRYYDRQHFIDTYFRDEQTLVVYFDFTPAGVYEGMSYYFGSGDGCGFCYDGSVVSTVRFDGGRAIGSIESAPQDIEAHWKVAVDVPIAPTDHGRELPPGGGEPGTTYSAYHEALATGDASAVKPFYTNDLQAHWETEGETIAASYRQEHPDKSFRIAAGWSREDRALLLVEGETSYGRVRSEVQLVSEGGTWRIDNEMMQFTYGE
jgi:hypothetical protein